MGDGQSPAEGDQALDSPLEGLSSSNQASPEPSSQPRRTRRESGTKSTAKPFSKPASTSSNLSAGTKRRRGSGPEAPHKRRRSSTTDLESDSQAPAKSTRAKKPPNPPDTNHIDAGSDGEGTGSSPYGTRSRGRGAQSRPNYAEDDGDLDYQPAKRTSNVGTGSRLKQEVDNGKLSISNRRAAAKSADNTAVSSTTGSPAPSQQVPNSNGRSRRASKSTTPPPQIPGKKRKAAAASSQPASGTPAPVAAPTTRRTGQVTEFGTAHHDLGIISFDNCKACLQKGALVSDDKIEFRVKDFVYLVCEPPGEPYYIARIMEFIHKNNEPSQPVESIRVNWMYRPRDLNRKTYEPRLLFASMHADSSPLLSLRGKCNVVHTSRVKDLDAFLRQKDSFYFEQLYDRYMHRYFDVIPHELVTNIAPQYKKVIDEQWEFIIAENSKAKELTGASKTCKICGVYCPNNESVDCAVCEKTYHMYCIDPPLSKKPARGFAWSCGPCSRKQERKLEARNTPTQGDKTGEAEDEEALEEEEDLRRAAARRTKANTPDDQSKSGDDAKPLDRNPASRLWLWRYLGIHTKNQDLLDYNDRIYPRAHPRIGKQYQAVVEPWHGRPVEYPEEETKKSKSKANNKKVSKLSKEARAALDQEKIARAKTPWIQPRPAGYRDRGLDLPEGDEKSTGTVLIRLVESWERGEDPPEQAKPDDRARLAEDFVKRCQEEVKTRRGKDKSEKLRAVQPYNTEVLDKATHLIYENQFDADAAMVQFRKFIDTFVPISYEGEELRKFEEAVTKFGSNLMDITRYVKSRPFGHTVRFWYIWKKTPRGKEIWENYEGRKAKKELKRGDRSSLSDDVAHDADDSAFDTAKAAAKKRGFECKFCGSRESRAWHRAPGVVTGQMVAESPGKRAGSLMVSLCQLCAWLWRKYACHYENIDEVGKRVAAAGLKTQKRKAEEELFWELGSGHIAAGVTLTQSTVAVAQAIGMTVPARLIYQPDQEPAKKKAKIGQDRKTSPTGPPAEMAKKKPTEKPVEKPVEAPLVPDPPKFREFPCAVCNERGDEEELFCCRHCRMTVHRNCYGISDSRSSLKWACDTCQNDTKPQNASNYLCVLCPNKLVTVDIFEQPKAGSRKKTDREKEKERLEREMIASSTKEYLRKQEEIGRPVQPREAMKPTAGHRWMHITCATWIPQIKFQEPATFDKPEGMLAIPPAKFHVKCTICKSELGVCVTCHKCPASFHVSCAQQAGYYLGFDVTPVKGSRRDTVEAITLGSDKEAEKGSVEPVIYCKEHPPSKSILHPMHEKEAGGLNALQLYVRHFKMADPTLTSSARKSALLHAKNNANQTAGHRGSVSKEPNTPTSKVAHEPGPMAVCSEETDEEGNRILHLEPVEAPKPVAKQCSRCSCETSPKWHKLSDLRDISPYDDKMTFYSEFVCHRCSKEPPEARRPPSPQAPPSLQPAPPDTSMIHGQATQASGRMTNGEPNGAPHGVTNGKPNVTPGSVHTGMNGAPTVAPNGVPAGVPAGMPNAPPNGAPTVNGMHIHPSAPPPPAQAQPPPPPPPPHQQPPPMMSPHHVPPRPGSYYEPYGSPRGPIAPPQTNGHVYPPPHGIPPQPPAAHYHQPHHSPHSSLGGHPSPHAPHLASPVYGGPPPLASASPTSTTYGRRAHGAAGPLRYADDPFATVPASIPSPKREAPPAYPIPNSPTAAIAKGSASKDANLKNLMN